MIYKKQFGDPNATGIYKTREGFNLGRWQSVKRRDYKLGSLDTKKIRRLEEIGFKWTILQERFEKAFKKGYQETLKYKKQFGDPNAPKDYKTSEGYNLGQWQVTVRTSYKKGVLSDNRIKLLKNIDFSWIIRDTMFEEGYQETLKYKKQFGHSNAPSDYITPKGYKLGGWQSRLRDFYKKQQLPTERIRRLGEIGFKWEIFKGRFEQGYQETLKYKKQFGNANAPNSYTTPEGYRLGKWQGHIREFYKKKKLSEERIKKLEKIGFKWTFVNVAFEKGVKETLKYKQLFGYPNSPADYMTPEGYKLGRW